MADAADEANDLVELLTNAAIADARRPLAPGVEGECNECGYESPRLVHGRCAPCRDERDRRSRT